MSLFQLVENISNSQLKSDLPDLKVGKVVRVNVKLADVSSKTNSKKRVQSFTGTIISKRGGGINTTVTVRRVARGVGVERIFPIHSPELDSIEII
uniref:Ribosomal protein L19 n=1 Tax=Neodangemannia microcystis TaxID=173495 RepID=A0A1W6EH77_9CHLO|nr:ribosomal protein L19 [Neodangemannia microcystis]ARK14774.1 ribosomal protein L19 [Neodangemannia microcystis]